MEFSFAWFTQLMNDLTAVIMITVVLIIIFGSPNTRFRKFIQGIDGINLFLELDEGGKPTKSGKQKMWIFVVRVALVALVITSVFFYSFSAQLEFMYFTFFRWFLEFFLIIYGLLFFIVLIRGVILLLTKKMPMQESATRTNAD